MSKHTPGPWGIYFNSQDDFVVRKMFDDGTESHAVARVHSGAANARLIAAAPDLLDALKCLVGWFDDDRMNGAEKQIKKARAAIRKATGETQ